MNISFFVKHTYLLDDKNTGGKYLQRVSSRIFEQLAEYLDAKLNPTEGYENDVCIYLKPRRLDHIKDGSYVNVSDDYKLVEMLKTRPRIKVMAISQPHCDYLRSVLKNEVIYILPYHVNFENIRRDRKEVINCGYVGANSSFHVRVNEEIKKQLAEVGLNFMPLFNFAVREDIINYYKQIDLQIIGYFDYHKDDPYYHQTKIVNAMSFGIPTIAGPRLGYKEVEDFYIPANNMDELVKEVLRMKNPERYNQWPNKIIKEAEKYHISKVAELYKQLT